MCEVEIHAIKPERHRRIYHFFHYFPELLWNLSPTTSDPLRILILQTCQELQIINSGFLFIHLELRSSFVKVAANFSTNQFSHCTDTGIGVEKYVQQSYFMWQK